LGISFASYFSLVFRFGPSRAVGGAGLVKSQIRAAWKLTAGAFLLVILLAPPVAGQTPTASSPSRQSIELTVGHGRVLHLDEAAESVYVGDTTIADLRIVAPDVVYVYGRKIGSTNLIAISADQKVRASVAFRVVADPGSANKASRELQPTTHTNLKLFGNRVAAVGPTRRVEEALDVQNAAETFSPPNQPPINDTTIAGSQQINIRVRFAEVSREDVQRFGVGSSGGGGIAFGGSGSQLDALVKALQSNGMLTILAEPNLTAVTGRPASFLAGGEIPIPTPGNQAGQITVSYKPFGVSLEFTPTLIKTNRIGLRVRPEVSSLSRFGSVTANGIELPSLMVRRADTTVEVASGQTFAIAGLFQRQMSLDYDQTPEIADLPVLGPLFRSARYRRDESELVILITPILVEPVRDRGLATPLDRPAPPPPPMPVRQPPPPAAVIGKAPIPALVEAWPEPNSGLVFK
jgi:pilus assembly protein CpaC